MLSIWLAWSRRSREDGDCEYQVLVASRGDSIPAIAQLYRDRADAENVFDELKNHWGWGSFTTTDLKACRIAARMTAQIYTGGRSSSAWPARTTIGKPSRPLLLNSIVRQSNSGGQRFLTITSNHAKAPRIATFFAKLARELQTFVTIAEQSTRPKRWGLLLKRIFAGAFGVLNPATG